MLLGLTIVSSQEQFDIHKFCFGSFILFASIYMVTTLYLYQYCEFDYRSSPIGTNHRKSFHLKLLICQIKCVCIALMVFFYWYHNASCRPYVYTFFCMTEYAVVLLNMSFHMCAYLDFHGISVEVPSVINSKYSMVESRKTENERLIDNGTV